ncbi:unnamed protein product, partial [Gulo gulo]
KNLPILLFPLPSCYTERGFLPNLKGNILSEMSLLRES